MTKIPEVKGLNFVVYLHLIFTPRKTILPKCNYFTCNDIQDGVTSFALFLHLSFGQ